LKSFYRKIADRITLYFSSLLQLPQFGIYYSIVNGMIVGGICCALSGFLEFFSPGPHFVICAVVIRAVHATGNAFVITATFTYAAVEFENSVGTIFSLTRFAMNFAQLLGPSIGGAIYEAGGFYLPFVCMGSLQMLMGLLSIFCLPRSRIDEDGYFISRSEGNNGLKISIVNVLKIPTIWFSFMAFIVATVCNGFLSINLEPKVLRRFDLAPFYVGVLFGLKDGANCLSNPVWGYICDRKRDNSIKHYLVLSALFVALSFVLMGAGSIVNVDINLSMPLLIVALCFNGVGIGGQQVAGVVDALHEAVNAGYPDDPAMHGLIAGLWSSLSGLGRFTSRVGSGLLVDCIGFDKTAFIVVGLQVIIGAITLFYTVFCECTLKVRNSLKQCEDEVSIIDEESEEEDNNIGSHDLDLEAGNNGLPVFRDSTRTVTAKNSVSIDVPPSSQRSNRGNRKSRAAAGAGGSLQPHTTASGSVSSISSYPYSLPHSYFNTAE